MKLLHIEDDPHFAQLLHAEFLSCRTVLWEVVHAACLRDARDRLKSDTFDAVLADLSLPGSDELATCQEICRMVPDRPLVVLAHGNGLEIATQAVKLGAQDCLFKGSVNGPLVIRRVRFAIERFEASRERSRCLVLEPVPADTHRSTVGTGVGRPPHDADLAPSLPDTAFSADPNSDADPQAPLRVMHIEDDPSYAQCMRQQLEADTTGGGYEIEHYTSLGPALKRLRQGRFAAVVLDLSLPDAEGVDTLSAVLARAEGLPVVVVTGHNDESLAVQSVRQGAEDYLVKTDLGKGGADRSIRLAIARTSFSHGVQKENQVPGSQGFAPSVISQLRNGARRHPRYLLNKPIFVVPVRYNNMPDELESGEAMLVDLSAGGLAFQASKSVPLTSRHCVVGIEADDGQCDYAVVEVRNTQLISGGMRVGTRFATEENDLLAEANLMPTFDPRSGRLTTRLPSHVLDKWAELQIVRPVPLDRVFVCPECHALATFGNGCRWCGSTQLTTKQHIRHFACGYVGAVSEFETRGMLVCPDCHEEDLVEGADFKLLDGSLHCLRCGDSNAELAPVGLCLHCDMRFPMNDAAEESLVGYQTNRLDSQAHLDSV